MTGNVADEATPSSEDLFVCNGLDHSIYVEVSPTNLSRKFEHPLKKALRWFDFTITDWEEQVTWQQTGMSKI